MKYFIKSVGKNMLNIPDRTETKSGLTMTVKDGVVHVYGTKTVSGNIFFTVYAKTAYVKAGTTYRLSQNATGTRGPVQVFCGVNQGNFSQEPTFWNATTKTMTASGWLQFLIWAGGTGYADYYIRPQLEEGSTATAFEPFNIKNYIIADSKLPSGYQELEYLESDGYQYIDTGIMVKTATDRAIIKLAITNNLYRYIFGQYTSSCSNFIWLNSGRQYQYGWGRTYKQTNIQIDNNAHTYELYNDGAATFVIDGVIIDRDTTSSALYNAERSLWLLNGNTSTFTVPQPAQHLYYFKLFRSNILIADFIPARRIGDGVVGMYDTVSKQFFTNQGTGSFIAGPEIKKFRILEA